MKNRFLIGLFIVFFVNSGWSKTSILNRIISIEIKSTPVQVILKSIEKKADVQFSYNPSLIQEERLVSITILNKTIAFGLALIFNKNIRFKAVGNHIVLLKREKEEEVRKRKKSNEFTVFKGEIIDEKTQKPIEGASIYDIESRYAVISNSFGYYQLKIPNAEVVRSVYVRKKGYQEFVFVIDVTSDSMVYTNIKLIPKEKDLEKIIPRQAEPIYYPFEDRVLAGELVSHEASVHVENLTEISETRMAQISLVPSVGIGSNLSTNGLITNNFSLNLLAGYSNGVEGLEIGGILNVSKGDVKWVQLAGIYNLVGGNVQGIQLGGIMNKVRGDFLGVQMGGIRTVNEGDFLGVQAGGIISINRNNFIGLQMGGIKAITIGQLNGMQIGGIFSSTACGFNGMQMSGIFGYTDSISNGLQMSGISSVSNGTLNGGQISGITNMSKKGVNKVQIAGIVNYAEKNKGIQIASIVNVATINSGFQFGLINLSKEGGGLALGLINFSIKGYHKIDLYASESFPVNIKFKSGNKRFYNTYNFGIKFGNKPALSYGLGFGSNINVSEKFSVNSDISWNLVISEPKNLSHLYKLSSSIHYKIAKKISLFAGPSLNLNMIYSKNIDGIYSSNIGLRPFYEQELKSNMLQMWVGGQIGIQFF